MGAPFASLIPCPVGKSDRTGCLRVVPSQVLTRELVDRIEEKMGSLGRDCSDVQGRDCSYNPSAFPPSRQLLRQLLHALF